ncbi:MAG: penicillin acylase family protein [Alphaproteobacteria bacterium]|nr:penicillin acylase family protein [Alphaproteobacteria bacterium]
MRAAVALFPLLGGCALLTLAQTKRSHPRVDGVLQAERVDETFRIHRDVFGVPHVDATTEHDAWFGLGFAHAQDRLFQADLTRHLAHGRISEWVGESAVETDLFVGSMRLRDLGRAVVARLDDPSRKMLQAYTEGLNAGAASLKTLPVEYRLLGVDFEPWTPEDCLGITFLQSWNLSTNLRYELAAVLMKDVDPQILDSLLRTGPEAPPLDPYWSDLRTRDFGTFTPEFEGFTKALGGQPRAEASNNWVVGGYRTESGKPILANDPHLSQTVPSLWYVAHVKGGGLDVAGATLPGTPGFPVGHNARVAWGLTNVMADVVDVALLTRDGDSVIVESDLQPVEMRSVTARPRKAEPVTREIPWTRLGPVINRGGDMAMVLRWTALEIPDRTPMALYAMATATSAPELRDRLVPLETGVVQNVAMADVEGNWGWQVAGAIPVRRGHTGRLPYPATDPNHGWAGLRSDLPGRFGPSGTEADADREHWVVTANTRPDHPDADAIGTAWCPPHRYDRIREMLRDLPKARPADMSRIQNDVREMGAVRHLDRLLEGVEATGQGAICLDVLRAWDRQATAESKGAAVWEVFQVELLETALSDDLTAEQVAWLMDVSSTSRSLLDADIDRFIEPREDTVRTALTKTCERLATELGDPDGWSWGALHPLRLNHPFGTKSNLLAAWNLPETPFYGSGATVAAADFDWTADDWRVRGMASLRIVMPLDDLSKSTLVYPGGQGGQPLSPAYASHFDAFVLGETVPLYTDPNDIAAHVEHSVVVSP